MGIVTVIAVYFVIWWTVLFVVLPFGTRTQEEDGEVVFGTERGAPTRIQLGRKAIWTTIVAAVVTFCLWLAAYLGLTLEGVANIFTLPST